MFARFDENPAMTLQVIKETKHYGRTDAQTDGPTHGRTDARTDSVKTVYPLQTKFAGGINITSKWVQSVQIFWNGIDTYLITMVRSENAVLVLVP